jgi:glycosyltransferase involved in cell wall biosynthesis
MTDVLARDKRLIYVLNSYKKNESSHFFHVLHLLSVLSQRGVQIVLLIEKAYDLPTFKEENIKVIGLKNQNGLKRVVELYKLVKYYNKQGYRRTYIRISSITAIIAAISNKLNGGITFFWQSGTTIEWDLSQPLNRKKIRWYIKSFLPGYIARRVVDYFVTGPETMADYYETVAGVNRDKIRILYNDINLNRFQLKLSAKIDKQKFLKKWDFDDDSQILLLVHRLSPVRKTMMYFPHCLTALSNENLLRKVVVVVAGDGEELEPIKELTKSCGFDSNCLFLGDVANSQIEKLYSISDIFIHPTYNEGFPRVILEAMASGLPIVSTNAGGTSEIVGELQSKYISDKDDIASFSSNLVKVLEDNELKQELSRENIRHVERYSTEKIALMYERVIFDDNA